MIKRNLKCPDPEKAFVPLKKLDELTDNDKKIQDKLSALNVDALVNAMNSPLPFKT